MACAATLMLLACTQSPTNVESTDPVVTRATNTPQAVTETTSAAVQVTPLVDNLRGPTQIAMHPDGRLLVAEIGEGEGTATGTVTAIDLDNPADREVLVEGLNTPTGVTVADGALWIMERTQLVTAPLAGGPTDVVFADMPNNGRSQGSLTTLMDGTLLFDTSGRRSGSGAASNSGILWLLDPTDPPSGQDDYGRVVIDGMKHAYATTQLADGNLAVTEMSDGRFDGEPAPDEVLVVSHDPGQTLHGGWPKCIGDREPVQEFGGSADVCASTVASQALFGPGATPTGVAVAPWDEQLLLVTNWTQDQIVGVRLDQQPPVTPTIVVAQITTPQHLLVDGQQVLVTSHVDGQILSFEGP